MIDPRRLCDDDNPRIRTLLRAGQREPHPERDLEKALAAVGAGGALLGVSQSAAAATAIGKVGLWSLAKWAGVGLVSGLVTLGGAHVVEQSFAPVEAPRASLHENVERHPAATPAQSKPTAEARPASSSETPAEPAAPIARQAPVGAAPHSAPLLPSGAAPRADPVTVEVLLIDEARRALARGQPRQTLATLARYRAEAPTQRLAPEARYLEMEAYLTLGDSAAARRVARTLVERYPSAPHAARARWVLGDRTKGFADH